MKEKDEVRDIDALLRATEKNRAELDKAAKKMDDLKATIRSVQKTQTGSMPKPARLDGK